MSTEEQGSRYWDWVDALGHWYFNRDLAQRQVRLHWPIHEEFSGREAEFLSVLREWCPLRGPVDVACELSERWSPHSGTITLSWAIPSLPDGGICDRPPYLPYLVAFAMAWETEGDFEPNAYYPRLNRILGQRRTPINSGAFSRANALWVDLEHWANEIMDGELGVFTAVSLGGMEHVGYPLSQVVLKPSERNRLHRLFEREGLTPDVALSDDDIQALLSRHREHFSARAQRSLDSVGSRFAKALFEEVRIELANWSPPNPRTQTRCGRVQGEHHGNQVRLRLACQVGLHSISRWFFTTASDNDDLPDAAGHGFAFKPGHVDGVLWQERAEMEATPDVGSFTNFVPLGQRLVLRTEDDTAIVWPGHGLRFLSPSYDRTGVYVEEEFIPYNGPTLVVCADDEANPVAAIADAKVPGTPWQGVSAWRVDSVQALARIFPQRRSYARRTSPIRCVGGVRCHPHGSPYFPFALPRIAIDDEWQLSVHTPGVTIRPLEGCALFELTINTYQPPEDITLEATRIGKNRRRQIVSVDGSPAMERDAEVLVAEESLKPSGTPALDNVPAWQDDTAKEEVSLGSDLGSCLLTFVSSWGECSYGTWSRVVNEVLRADQNYASRVARGLAALGHVCIQADPQTGHWKRLRVVPGRLRKLPWDMEVQGDRLPQAVIEGQLLWSQLDTMLKSLPYDVDFDITAQPVPYLPPRVRLYSIDASCLENAAGQMGLHYHQGAVPGCQNDVTAVTLECLRWHDGLITPADSVRYFSPLLLEDVDAHGQRFDDLCLISSRFLLAAQTETYGATTFYLCDLDASRRAAVPQGSRQWARWLCYIGATKRFYAMTGGQSDETVTSAVAMPYLIGPGQVLLPHALSPPPAATRTLVACSGLLPQLARKGAMVETVGALDQSTMEAFSHPFVIPRQSPLLVFDNVPQEVAEHVYQALGVTVRDLGTGAADEQSN